VFNTPLAINNKRPLAGFGQRAFAGLIFVLTATGSANDPTEVVVGVSVSGQYRPGQVESGLGQYPRRLAVGKIESGEFVLQKHPVSDAKRRPQPLGHGLADGALAVLHFGDVAGGDAGYFGKLLLRQAFPGPGPA